MSDSIAGRSRAEGEAKEAKSKLVGENRRIGEWVSKAQVLAERYAAWTLAVAAEFGIATRGPLLKLPDGRLRCRAYFRKTWRNLCRSQGGPSSFLSLTPLG